MQLIHFMTSYSITKYNPEKRNAQGHYLDHSEWTSIGDIGKPEYNNLDYAAYEKTETAYVDAIKIILNDINVTSLKVESLELHMSKEEFEKEEATWKLKNIHVDFDKEILKLKNGFELDFESIEKIIRLILRDCNDNLITYVDNDLDGFGQWKYQNPVWSWLLYVRQHCKFETLHHFKNWK